MTNCSQKVSKLYTFLESTYPEIQRKHIPRVYEYQSLTSSHTVDDCDGEGYTCHRVRGACPYEGEGTHAGRLLANSTCGM